MTVCRMSLSAKIYEWFKMCGVCMDRLHGMEIDKRWEKEIRDCIVL